MKSQEIFKTVKKKIETPICEMTAKELEKQIVIVPILRAGLGMVEGIHNIIPTAKNRSYRTL